MIIGIGSDIVDIRRIARMLERHGERFLHRVYAQAERETAAGYVDPAPYLARRFAAKEAVAKALGTGFRQGVGWTDIAIESDDLGAPTVRLSGRAAERLQAITPAGHEALLHLSISDEPPYALAFAVIEGRPFPRPKLPYSGER